MRKFIAGGFLVVLLVAAGMLTIPSASAKFYDEDGEQLPFYARIEHNEIFHDDDWAVIVFYRSPDCIPDGFNLLDQFDFGAFGCASTVEGFALKDDDIEGQVPTQVKLYGLGAVPVWFVEWGEFQDAIVGGLTIVELEGLDSLRKGTASTYNETIHPFQSNKNGMIQFAGNGTLDGSGQPFVVQALFNFTSGGLKTIQIQFK